MNPVAIFVRHDDHPLGAVARAGAIFQPGDPGSQAHGVVLNRAKDPEAARQVLLQARAAAQKPRASIRVHRESDPSATRA
jgi:hypothetical protein